MKLFQRREYDTPEEKKLSALRFGFFFVSILSFMGPFAFLYVLNMARGGAWLWAFALWPSLKMCAITVVILVVAYFVYRAILLRGKS